MCVCVCVCVCVCMCVCVCVCTPNSHSWQRSLMRWPCQKYSLAWQRTILDDLVRDCHTTCIHSLKEHARGMHATLCILRGHVIFVPEILCTRGTALVSLQSNLKL
jgi:hypothetical protein